MTQNEKRKSKHVHSPDYFSNCVDCIALSIEADEALGEIEESYND